MDMEDEYEEMKAKLKYSNGKFLENDRKENEIYILRTENINLKNVISKLENKIKEHESTNKNNDNIIKKLQEKINLLNIKLDQKEKELNSYSNVNICINNCTGDLLNQKPIKNYSHISHISNIERDIKKEFKTLDNQNRENQIFKKLKQNKLFKNENNTINTSNIKIKLFARNESTDNINLSNNCIKNFDKKYLNNTQTKRMRTGNEKGKLLNDNISYNNINISNVNYAQKYGSINNNYNKILPNALKKDYSHGFLPVNNKAFN